MKENYLIKIVGSQEIDGENDKVEVTTIGDYFVKDGKTYITYKEYDNDNPSQYSSNVVKITNDNEVTIIRRGETSTRLVLQKGIRHQCHYNTPLGEIMIGVYAEKIVSKLNNHGGNLKVQYTLDFNADQMSKNSFEIDVRENEKE